MHLEIESSSNIVIFKLDSKSFRSIVIDYMIFLVKKKKSIV